ncbi:MAG: hypothetical protein ACYTGN_19085 [Planctomycetota bacterium]|jgi:hypothetical protein
MRLASVLASEKLAVDSPKPQVTVSPASSALRTASGIGTRT